MSHVTQLESTGARAPLPEPKAFLWLHCPPWTEEASLLPLGGVGLQGPCWGVILPCKALHMHLRSGHQPWRLSSDSETTSLSCLR